MKHALPYGSLVGRLSRCRSNLVRSEVRDVARLSFQYASFPRTIAKDKMPFPSPDQRQKGKSD